MKIYKFFADRHWPRTYTGKILLVSFVGVHVPMFGAVGYTLLADATPFMQQLDVLAAMLVATLVGTFGTMFVMHALLSPVRLAARAAEGYLDSRTPPRLPTRYSDDAGSLMASVQECITRLDSALAAAEMHSSEMERDNASKFKVLAGMRHDFRTPLTSILGFAELMKSEAIGPLGGEHYRKFSNNIVKSGHDLLRTLESVIDLSDAESQEQREEDSEEFDLVEMAESAIALEHLHAERRGVEVALNGLASHSVHSVYGVVKNLLSALLQAGISGTPEGGKVNLTISGTADQPSISVESRGGTLFLEDVPSDVATEITHLESGTGAKGAGPETATPMTLRVALIKTLGRTINASLSITQAQAGRFEMTVSPAISAPAARIAAE